MKSIFKFEIYSTIFIFVIGTLLHFTYNSSNNNIIIGLFSPINESTWEHLKLVFSPILITIIIGNHYFKSIYPNYLCIKTKGLIISMLFIIFFYYIYTGILGYNIILFNISSFFIATIIGEYYTYKNIDKNICNNKIAILLLIIISIIFIIFTFNPPHINLFIDPITKTYGIKKK